MGHEESGWQAYVTTEGLITPASSVNIFGCNSLKNGGSTSISQHAYSPTIPGLELDGIFGVIRA